MHWMYDIALYWSKSKISGSKPDIFRGHPELYNELILKIIISCVPKANSSGK